MLNKKIFRIFTFSGLIPLVVFLVWAIWHGFSSLTILPEFFDDSLYYYSRVKEIFDGNVLIGNPYFIEHSGEISPAFFVADLFSAIPLFFKLGINLSVFVNLFFYFGLFTTLIYTLFKSFEISNKQSVTISFLVLFAVFSFLFRPVAMQIVFPAFIFFLISLKYFIDDPKNKKNKILLIISSSLSFYLYTYLWQIVFVALFILLILTSLKTFKEYIGIFKVKIFSLIISLPIFIYTFLQIRHPDYWQTVERIGLINTHTFGIAFLEIFALSFIVFLVLFWFFKKKEFNIKEILFWSLGFLALVITGGSNIISGKDLETGVHILRFFDLFLIIFLFRILGVLLSKLEFNKYVFKQKQFYVFLVVAIFIFVNIFDSLKYTYKSVYLSKDNSYIKSTIDFLNSKDNVFVAVAPQELASYIPVYTKGYVLFHPNGGLHLINNEELIDRYLVSNYGNLTLDKIKKDLRLYGGAGNAEHGFRVFNREVSICQFFSKIFNNQCDDKKINAIDYMGEEYFKNIFEKYQSNEKIGLLKLLEKYKVTFLIERQNISIYNGFGLRKVYEDSNYVVYFNE